MIFVWSPLTMIKTLLVLFLAFLPTLLHAHGCSKVDLSSELGLANFLDRPTNLVPEAMKEFANQYPNSTGVYDCHEGVNDHEVGYTGLCNSNGTVCACTALFNFEPCVSCTLSCHTVTNGSELTINSFTADCSNIQPAGSVAGPCKIGCGFDTDGCFETDADDTPNESSESTANSRSNYAFSVVLAWVVGSFLFSL